LTNPITELPNNLITPLPPFILPNSEFSILNSILAHDFHPARDRLRTPMKLV
jgi:hypothetical protein